MHAGLCRDLTTTDDMSQRGHAALQLHALTDLRSVYMLSFIHIAVLLRVLRSRTVPCLYVGAWLCPERSLLSSDCVFISDTYAFNLGCAAMESATSCA